MWPLFSEIISVCLQETNIDVNGVFNITEKAFGKYIPKQHLF
jgi:hypothetical protein